MIWTVDWGYPSKSGTRSWYLSFPFEKEALNFVNKHLKYAGPIQANYRIYQGTVRKTND